MEHGVGCTSAGGLTNLSSLTVLDTKDRTNTLGNLVLLAMDQLSGVDINVALAIQPISAVDHALFGQSSVVGHRSTFWTLTSMLR